MASDRDNRIGAISGVNMQGTPFVQIRKGDSTVAQFDIMGALDFAITIMRCREAALTDAFLAHFLTIKLGIKFGEPAFAGLMMEYRKFREDLEGMKTAPLSFDEALPTGDIKGAKQ